MLSAVRYLGGMVIELRVIGRRQAFVLRQPDDKSGCWTIIDHERCMGPSNHLGPHSVGRPWGHRPHRSMENKNVSVWR